MSSCQHFVFIVIFLYCWSSSNAEVSTCAHCQAFDLKTVIMLSIGGCILLAVLVLIALTICVFTKLAKSTKSVPAAKNCASGPLKKKTSATNTQVAKSVTPVSSTTVQLCEECSMCATYEPLPPCFCDANEGL